MNNVENAIRKAQSVAALMKLPQGTQMRIEDFELFDSATYAANGQTQLVFFQSATGQNGKTEEDTNMMANGMLPNPAHFLITGVELDFQSGAAVNPASANAGRSADFDAFYKAGRLKLNVGSREGVIDCAPLGRFPAQGGKVESSVAAVAHASEGDAMVMDVARFEGRRFNLELPVLIRPNENFKLQLDWPTGAKAMPSTAAGKVYARLIGYIARSTK